MNKNGKSFLNHFKIDDKMSIPLFLLATILLIVISPSMILAESQPSQTEIIPLGNLIGLEKTIVSMNIAEDNTFPWAFVEGKIANPTTGYPVIIQIYQNGEPHHFAQTNVNDDGTYKYKFRVLDVSGGYTTKVFEGDYTVIIFKVVNLNSVLI